MSFEWINVSVYHGSTRLHEKAAVMVVGNPSAMFVWDDQGTTIYTDVVNLSTNRFAVTSPAREPLVLSIDGAGGCGCG